MHLVGDLDHVGRRWLRARGRLRRPGGRSQVTVRGSIPALYGCAPLGRGTAQVESLTSFFLRLCLRRGVRPADVVHTVLRPCVPEGSFPSNPGLGTVIASAGGRFDAADGQASLMVSALEAATHRSGLAAHTLLSFAGLFRDDKNSPLAVIKHRRWCPACFADRARQGLSLWEPLLWRLNALMCCPVHGTPLRDRCLRCDARQRSLPVHVPLGFCRACGHPLHGDCDHGVPDPRAFGDDQRWAVSHAWVLGRMLVAGPGSAWSRDGFVRLFSHAFEHASDRGLTEGDLSCALGVYPHVGRAWRAGSSFPTLREHVAVCLQLGADPVDVLSPDFDPGRPVWPPPGDPVLQAIDDPWSFALRARECVSRRRYPDLSARLDAAAAEATPPSMKHVAVELETTYAHLKIRFPVYCAQRRAVRAQHVSEQRTDARRRARVALDRAIAAGGSVTAFQAGRWARVNEASLADHWPGLYRRLRKLVDARVVSHDPGFVGRCRTALQAALRAPRGVTAAEVARSLEITGSLLQCTCPELYRNLVDLRRQESADHRAEVRAALEVELSSSEPRGLGPLAIVLGVRQFEIQREKDLFSRLVAKRRRIRRSRAREVERLKLDRATRRAARDAERRLLIERLEVALRDELLAPFPRTPRQIALDHGTDSWFLRRYCREAHTRLLELRAALVKVSTDSHG